MNILCIILKSATINTTYYVKCPETVDDSYDEDLADMLETFRENLPDTLFGLAIEVVNVEFSTGNIIFCYTIYIIVLIKYS